MNSYFPDPLEFRDAGMAGGSRVFQLTHYFRYISSVGTITVPTGFRTDGASVPRMFWPIFDPYAGNYLHAAVIHDYLYSVWSDCHFKADRYTADWLFKEAMFNSGISWPTRETIYRAVRMFGWRAFKARK
jgi:hypothetical protein